jgi:NitT/TauT family transport system substrate-binding protein
MYLEVMKKLVFIALALVLMAGTGIGLIACNSAPNNSSATVSASSSSTKNKIIDAPTVASTATPQNANASISTTTLVPPIAEGNFNKITLGYKGAACEPYFYAGIEKGIFKKYGLDVTAFKQSGDDPTITGKTDVTDQQIWGVIPLIRQGANLKFTIALHQGCVSSIVKPDSTYKSWKDLKGKTIGFAGAIGGPTQLYCFRLLIAAGMDPNKDVNWQTYADSATLILGFENGEVDCAAGGDRLNYLEVVAGKARWFSYLGSDPEFQDQTCCLLIFNGDFIKNHPDVARAFTAACYEASLWCADNMEEAVQIEVDKKYIAGNYADNIIIQRTYPYIPGYDIGWRTVYKSIVDYSSVGVIEKVEDPTAATNELVVKFDGIPN